MSVEMARKYGNQIVDAILVSRVTIVDGPFLNRRCPSWLALRIRITWITTTGLDSDDVAEKPITCETTSATRTHHHIIRALHRYDKYGSRDQSCPRAFSEPRT